MRYKVLLFIASLAACLTARADSFTFSFSGNGHTGAGVFTASLTATPDVYLITDIFGTTDGQTILALLPPGSYPTLPPGSAPNDNLLFYPGDQYTYFDYPGVSYLLTDGTSINLFDFPDGSMAALGSGNPGTYVPLTSLNIEKTSPVPEPGGLVLLATGAVATLRSITRRNGRSSSLPSLSNTP